MSDCLTLKKSNCKNCYKCIRHCPVKSIRFSGNQAYIIGNECILCGQCFVVCPQDAKQIVDESEKVRVLLQSGDPVIVSLAPSFVANYDGVGIGSCVRRLKAARLSIDAEETADRRNYRQNRNMSAWWTEGDRNVIITSCCHSINLLIQKVFILRYSPILRMSCRPCRRIAPISKRDIPTQRPCLSAPALPRRTKRSIMTVSLTPC